MNKLITDTSALCAVVYVGFPSYVYTGRRFFLYWIYADFSFGSNYHRPCRGRKRGRIFKGHSVGVRYNIHLGGIRRRNGNNYRAKQQKVKNTTNHPEKFATSWGPRQSPQEVCDFLGTPTKNPRAFFARGFFIYTVFVSKNDSCRRIIYVIR